MPSPRMLAIVVLAAALFLVAAVALAQRAPVPAQPTLRAPVRIGSAAARRIVIDPYATYVLQEDGVLVAWSSDPSRVPSYRVGSGPVPGAREVVDFCGAYAVLASGALAELTSAGTLRPGGASIDARGCAFHYTGTLCVVDRGGDVRCRYERGAASRPVEGARGAARVEATSDDVCALAGGDLVCWREATAPRVVVSGVAAFDLSNRTGCAVRTDGVLVCWSSRVGRPFDLSRRVARERCAAARGDDERERLCAVLSEDEPDERPLAEVGIVDAVDVTVLETTGVVVLRDGRVLAWGTHGDFWSNDEAVREVPWLRGARHVELGAREVCAVLADGHAGCWPREARSGG